MREAKNEFRGRVMRRDHVHTVFHIPRYSYIYIYSYHNVYAYRWMRDEIVFVMDISTWRPTQDSACMYDVDSGVRSTVLVQVYLYSRCT